MTTNAAEAGAGWPLIWWLRLLVVVAVLPAWGVTALLMASSFDRDLKDLKASTIERAQSVMTSVDRELTGAISSLQALAVSPALTAGDLAGFQAQAREFLNPVEGKRIVLFDAGGGQLMNTADPGVSPLRRTGSTVLLPSVLKTGKPKISDYFTGGVPGQRWVAVSVPVFRGESVIYSLSIKIPSEYLQDRIREQQRHPDWIVTLYDREGTIIARTPDFDEFVGRKRAPELLQKMHGQQGFFEHDTPDGVRMLVSFNHSKLSGWAAEVCSPMIDLGNDLRRSLWLSIAGAAIVFVFGSLVATVISHRIAHAIRSLTRPARALALGAPVVAPRAAVREVVEVGRALVDAARTLEERTEARDSAEARARAHAAELAHIAGVTFAGEIAAGIAHELSQPLSAIGSHARGCTELLDRRQPDLDALKTGVTAVLTQTERAADILIRLRDFVRPDGSRREPLAVTQLIADAIAFAKMEPGYPLIHIKVRPDRDLPMLFVDRVEIGQVFLNILRNAIDSMVAADSRHKWVVIVAKRREAEPERIEISITDSGPGMSPELEDRIFRPFVTTKSRGMGMGLAISRRIIASHGGTLRLISRQGAGVTFAFDLPTVSVKAHDHAA